MASTPAPLRVTSGFDGADTVLVAVVGEIDMTNADRLREAFDEALVRAKTLEVDLGEVSFLDSTAINALIRARNMAVADGRRVVVSRVPAFARQVFELAGIAKLFDLPDD
jgi:anti-anti-sigma factor